MRGYLLIGLALLIVGFLVFQAGYGIGGKEGRAQAIAAWHLADSLQTRLGEVLIDVDTLHQQNLNLNAKAAEAELALQSAINKHKPLRQAIYDALEAWHSTSDLDSLRNVLVGRPD